MIYARRAFCQQFKQGFTLVEMLLVLVLIGILAGSVVVAFSGRQDKYALQATADDLAAAIRYAATQAKLTNIPYRVSIDDAGADYQILTRLTPASDYLPDDGIPGTKHLLIKGVQIVSIARDGAPPDDLTRNLDFSPDGSGFSGKLILQNRQQESKLIEVLPSAGQVRVSQ